MCWMDKAAVANHLSFCVCAINRMWHRFTARDLSLVSHHIQSWNNHCLLWVLLYASTSHCLRTWCVCVREKCNCQWLCKFEKFWDKKIEGKIIFKSFPLLSIIKIYSYLPNLGSFSTVFGTYYLILQPWVRFQGSHTFTKMWLYTLLINDWSENIVTAKSLDLRHKTYWNSHQQ